jgi:hypothetical protein
LISRIKLGDEASRVKDALGRDFFQAVQAALLSGEWGDGVTFGKRTKPGWQVDLVRAIASRSPHEEVPILRRGNPGRGRPLSVL